VLRHSFILFHHKITSLFLFLSRHMHILETCIHKAVPGRSRSWIDRQSTTLVPSPFSLGSLLAAPSSSSSSTTILTLFSSEQAGSKTRRRGSCSFLKMRWLCSALLFFRSMESGVLGSFSPIVLLLSSLSVYCRSDSGVIVSHQTSYRSIFILHYH
jgi:hypothetical protein